MNSSTTILPSVAVNMPAPRELFLQNALSQGDYCPFLNITKTTMADVNNLTGKFAVLDSHRGTPVSIVEFLFSNFIHQYIVANCSFQYYQQQLADPNSTYYYWYIEYYRQNPGLLASWGWYITAPGVVALLGIPANLSLVLIMCWRMTFAKMCNWLIAFDSLCQVFVVSPFVVQAFALFAQTDHIDFRLCLSVLMISTIGSYASFLTLFIISVERLLNVLFALEMNLVSPKTLKVCAIVSCFLSLVFGAVMTLFVFNIWTVINLPYSSKVYCNTGLYPNVLSTPITYALISLTVLNYVIILVIVFAKHRINVRNHIQDAQGQDTKTMKRMLHSVIAITMVLIIGFLIATVARNTITSAVTALVTYIAKLVYPDNSSVATISSANWNMMLIGIITCIPLLASSSNAPLLYVLSTEYRKAYRDAFRKVIGICSTRSNRTAGLPQPLFVRVGAGSSVANANSMNLSNYNNLASVSDRSRTQHAQLDSTRKSKSFQTLSNFSHEIATR